MAKKETRIEEDIIDLTELIESGNAGDSRAKNAYAKAAALDEPAGTEDDFASILSGETGGQETHKVDPDEKLDMSDMGGIDNLLESLDIPPQPRESAPKSGAAPHEDDLDSVLDDLLGTDTPPKNAAAQAAQDEPVHEEIPPADAGAPKPAAKPAAEAAGLDSDLDDILASFDEPVTKEKQREQKTAPDVLDDILNDEPVPQSKQIDEKDLAADLDDILDDVELPAPPPSPEAPAAKKPVDGTKPESAFEEVAPHSDVASAPAARPQTPASQSGLEDISDELDAMLDAEAPLAPETQTAKGASSLPAHVPADTGRENPAGTSLPGTEPVPVQGQIHNWSPETLAGICRNLAAVQDEGTRNSLQEFSRELGAQTAHMEDIGNELLQLGKRLLACESKLSAARARITGLEKAMEATAALGDLLKEGTPLHAGFMGLISTAVTNALKGFSAPAGQPDEELLARIAQLETGVKEIGRKMAEMGQLSDTATSGADEEISRLIANADNSDARISELEKKIAVLQAQFGKEMEKAAAATVVKVLQEEITRLAGG